MICFCVGWVNEDNLKCKSKLKETQFKVYSIFVDDVGFSVLFLFFRYKQSFVLELEKLIRKILPEKVSYQSDYKKIVIKK